jgi:antitoxin component of MazEF toxin-antitoxin module
MPEYEVERRLIGIGESLAVVIPLVWARAWKISKGQRVTVVFNARNYLLIRIKGNTTDKPHVEKPSATEDVCEKAKEEI